MTRILIYSLVFAALSVLGATEAPAQYHYTQDFSSAADLDTMVSNDVFWDPVAQEIRLYDFQPILHPNYDTTGAARGVTVVGNVAYVGDGYSGLQILDVSDPAAPTLLSTLNTAGYSTDVEVLGDFAFVADSTPGIQVVDVQDPAAPVLVTTIATGGYARGLELDGALLYAALSTTGFAVIDVSNPVLPVVLGSMTTAGASNRDLSIHGDHLYLAAEGAGLLIADVSNPAGPYSVTSVTTTTLGGNAYDVEVDGDFCYVATQTVGLTVLDISSPMAPVVLSTASVGGAIHGLDVEGDRVQLCTGKNGLATIDVSDPTNPTVLFTIDTDNSYDVDVHGTTAFVADSGSGLQPIEIAEQTDLLRRSTISSPSVQPPVVQGDRLFLPYALNGLRIYNVTNVDNPKLVVTFNNGDDITGVDVRGDYVFAATDAGGMSVYDITNELNIKTVSSLALPGACLDIEVRGDLAVVAAGVNGMHLVDVSDPAAPTLLSTFTPFGYPEQVHLFGNLAVPFGYNSPRLEFVDVSNPAAPVLLSSTGTGGDVLAVAIEGDHAYVAAQNLGIRVFDISDLAAPVLIATVGLASLSTEGLVVDGDDLYVGYQGAIRRYDISNPALPSSRGSVTNSATYDLVPFGDHLIASNNSGSTTILTMRQSEVQQGPRAMSSRLLPAGGPATHVRLNSVQTGDVSWDVVLANGGFAQSVSQNVWTSLQTTDTDYYWLSTHSYSPGTKSPVRQLDLEFLYDYAQIESITDIANDQGRQVSLEWARSGHDMVGDAQQVVEYAIYRRIDPGLGSLAKAALPADASPSLAANAAAMQAAGWHYLMRVPVLVQDRYAAVVPTLADSTAGGDYQSVFQVVALTATPGMFFTSMPDSGRSVDNLAPAVPLAMTASYGATEVSLDWADSPEADLQYYRVYRGPTPDFTIDASNLVGQSAQSDFVDARSAPWGSHYKVSAVDFSGNESAAAATQIATDAPRATARLVLGDATPNPFNPSTTLRFALPVDGPVRLVVHDLAGRLVRTLVREHLDAGEHTVRFDGLDDRGRRVSSGVYLYRLETPAGTLTKRMVMVK